MTPLCLSGMGRQVYTKSFTRESGDRPATQHPNHIAAGDSAGSLAVH